MMKFATAFLLLLTACAAPRAVNSQASLQASRWELAVLNGTPFVSSTRFKTPFLDFEAQTVSGNAGCNSLRGAVVLDGKRLRFQPLATTRMACEGLATERAFVQALEKVDNYTIENGQLQLRSGDTVLAILNAAAKK